jgi:FKBP-type peptidyl-prolyl cis-trans isomerase SlyD
MVQIADKSVVNFHYTLRDEHGEQLETSRGGDPTAYLHGADNFIRGLEGAMLGKESGDVFSATIGPSEGYGERREGKEQRVPMKHLMFNGKLKPGMTVHLNTEKGAVPVTVVKAGRHSADVDTNHPMAGRTLTFDIEIVDVREATEEEASHGHAHGAGGHQH